MTRSLSKACNNLVSDLGIMGDSNDKMTKNWAWWSTCWRNIGLSSRQSLLLCQPELTICPRLKKVGEVRDMSRKTKKKQSTNAARSKYSLGDVQTSAFFLNMQSLFSFAWWKRRPTSMAKWMCSVFSWLTYIKTWGGQGWTCFAPYFQICPTLVFSI